MADKLDLIVVCLCLVGVPAVIAFSIWLERKGARKP